MAQLKIPYDHNVQTCMFLHKIVALANYNLNMLIQKNVVLVKHVVGSLLKYVSAPTA